MKEKKLYHKLVRDRIPEVIQESGKAFKIHQAPGDRLKDYAMRKLQEEVQEFVENPCAEEAGDIIEIFEFICKLEGLRTAEINAERTSKRVTKGGFDRGVILEWVEEP